MGKRLVSTIGVLSFFIYTAAAQEQVMTIEDLFQLADQNSKSIQLHSLAIDETTQAVEVAKKCQTALHPGTSGPQLHWRRLHDRPGFQ